MTCSSLSRRHSLSRVTSVAMAALALAVLNGCASTPSPDTEREVLLQRAREYWELSRKNDNANAWKYEAASKDHSMTLEGYLKRGGIVYDSVDVRDVASLQGDEAKLNVHMRYSVPLVRIRGMNVETQDTWRRIDGLWYHVIPRSSLFPDAKP